MKRHGLHVISRPSSLDLSVNPSADRSDNDRARSDNHRTRSNNNSTWGDNNRACGDAARPVYSGRADDGACLLKAMKPPASNREMFFMTVLLGLRF
jgi:hypothetical protein